MIRPAPAFARLASATGLAIAEAASDRVSNLDILVVTPESYPADIAWAGSVIGAGFGEAVAAFRTRRWTPCAGALSVREVADADGPAGSIGYALVMLRAGLSPEFRLSCIEEELTQALGPANDHDRVRPSIFNDDEEFALLTRHDELLLAALYDPRLAAGMPKAEALARLPAILEDLRPGG